MAGLMDITKAVSHEFGVTKADARKVVEFVCGQITQNLGEGNPVNLRGFGVFKVKEMGARTIKNPRTHEDTPVDPSVRVLFTAAAAMKNELKYAKGMITEEAYKAAKSKTSDDEVDAEDAGEAEPKADAKAAKGGKDKPQATAKK